MSELTHAHYREPVPLIFISRQNKLVCTQRASKKIARFVPLRVHLLDTPAWVAGIHSRGEDLAFFPPGRFFPRHLFIFVVRMQCISVDFTSCGLLFIREECRISSLCSPSICCRMQGKRIHNCKVRIELCFLAKNSA